jgi:ferric-dicitrate binding protein FerR (iron transport regulator)
MFNHFTYEDLNQKKNIDNLIAKSLADETSTEETDIINKWISASEYNCHYYSDIKTIFEIAGRLDLQKESETLMDLNDDLPTSLNIEQSGKMKRFITFIYTRAALFISLFGVTYLLYNYPLPKENGITILSSGPRSITHTLLDGTSIILSPESSISYESSYNNTNRKIKLKGEAYFKVRHNPDRPFSVNIDNVFIEDIGTSFRICAKPNDSTYTVYVDEGQAMFYTSHNPGVLLTVNEIGIYNQTSKVFRKIKLTPSIKNRKLHFENASLRSVIDSLNIVYNTSILLSCKEMESLELTATFEESSVFPIIEIIAETFHLSITRKNEVTLLNNPLCKGELLN